MTKQSLKLILAELKRESDLKELARLQEKCNPLKLEPVHDCDETCRSCPQCYVQSGETICDQCCPCNDVD